MSSPAYQSTPARSSARQRAISVAGVTLAIVAGIGLALSGFGYRSGWWGLRGAFRTLAWCVRAGGEEARAALERAVVRLSSPRAVITEVVAPCARALLDSVA